MANLSIIIVHHRTPEVLRLCLKSIGAALMSRLNLEAQPRDPLEAEPLSSCEIIVVDSMSSRQSRDVVTEFQTKEAQPREHLEVEPLSSCDVRILPFDYNLGFSRGVNIGIREATGQYLLILNPDVVITPGSIETMIYYIKAHPDIGMLGPHVLNFNGTHQQTYFSYYKPATVLARRTFLGLFKPYKKMLDDFLMTDTDPEEMQTPDWLMGSAIMVSRKAIEKVGLMDERFFMYFEDVDWARRFWHNDYKVVYYPKAIVYHYHQRESKSRLGLLDAFFNKKTRWHISSAMKFFLKYKNLQKTYNN